VVGIIIVGLAGGGSRENSDGLERAFEGERVSDDLLLAVAVVGNENRVLGHAKISSIVGTLTRDSSSVF